MKEEFRNIKVLVRGKKVFIGCVHRKSWHVTARRMEKKFSMRGSPLYIMPFGGSWTVLRIVRSRSLRGRSLWVLATR